MHKPGQSDEAEFELSRYLDGQLSRAEAKRLEQKIERDPALAEELRRYATLEGLLAAMGRAPLPVDAGQQRADIMAALEREGLLSARPDRMLILRPVFRYVAAAAAVAVLVTAAALVFRGAGRSTETARRPASPSGQSGPVVQAAVVREEPNISGQAEVKVEFAPTPFEELRLAEEPAPLKPSMPPDTVIVSVGGEGEEQQPVPAFPIFVD